jgi:phage host-nuclease inhibitor protein Gam
MYEFLTGFYERMEFIAVVDSIVNRKNKNNEIEDLFCDHELDNMIMSVLLFIMEKTLLEDDDCTIDSISDFLMNTSEIYKNGLSQNQIEMLSRYIVKDILQNKGETRTYNAMDFGGGIKPLRIRLINDKLNNNNKVIFSLSDQGYNFLFRTKEVDKELGFTMEELKLRELIKRKNYKKAVEQSRELVRMLLSKRNDLNRFEHSLKSSIFSVDVAEYESLINDTHGILEQEYQIMSDIRQMIDLSKKHLREEELSRGFLDNDMKTAKAEISAISKNINNTINFQRILIVKLVSLKTVYLEILKEAFSQQQVKRFDFEKEILGRLESLDDLARISDIRKGLLSTLFMPQVDESLNLLRIYDRQSKLRELMEQQTGYSEDETVPDSATQRIERKNFAYVLLFQSLFEFAQLHCEGFTLAEFFENIRKALNFDLLKEDRLIYTAMLKLYEYEIIDIDQWKLMTEDISPEGNGEFDLSFCLYSIEKTSKNFYGIKSIRVTKSDDIYTFKTQTKSQDMLINETVQMNDLNFEVILSE